MDNKAPHRPRPKTSQAISLCRMHIQKGLEAILREHGYRSAKKITMNYDNYESKIVEAYGVALVGLPCMFGNPGSIGRENVYKLLEALEPTKSGVVKCYWVKLSDDELVARRAANAQRVANGERVYKPRKPYKKKVKAPTASATSKDVIDDEDEDAEGEEEEEEPPEEAAADGGEAGGSDTS